MGLSVLIKTNQLCHKSKESENGGGVSYWPVSPPLNSARHLRTSTAGLQESFYLERTTGFSQHSINWKSFSETLLHDKAGPSFFPSFFLRSFLLFFLPFFLPSSFLLPFEKTSTEWWQAVQGHEAKSKHQYQKAITLVRLLSSAASSCFYIPEHSGVWVFS